MQYPDILIGCWGMTKARAVVWVPVMLEAENLAAINTKQRRACWLAQLGHESGCGLWLKELWGPTKQQLKYEPPSTLARALGNVSPGSGKRYMGRGLVQITGEGNYKFITSEMRKILPGSPDFHAQPELLSQPRYAALSAALFWKRKNLNTFCDSLDFSGLTKRINGGYTGLAHRQTLYTKALTLLT